MHNVDQSQYGAWLRTSAPKLSRKSSSQNLGKKIHSSSSSFNTQTGEDGEAQVQDSSFMFIDRAINNIPTHNLATKETSTRGS